MLDSGAGSLYLRTDLVINLNLKAFGREVKTIKQLEGRFTKNDIICKLQVSSRLLIFHNNFGMQ